MCPGCHGFEMEAIEASGRGTIHSFVVAHHPPMPPFAYPNVIVLVELDGGDAARVAPRRRRSRRRARSACRSQVEFETVDGDLALHFFRPVAA